MDLKYFLSICETKSLSRASERLGVAQPTLSQALKRLEQVVGAPLVLRKKTGIELTRAGEIFRRRATDLINSWAGITAEAKSSVTAPRGHFVIGAHVSVTLYSAAKFLPSLTREYADLEFDLIHGLSREILEGVVSSKIDFGIVINPRRHPDLVIKRLAMDRVGFWRAAGPTQKDVLFCEPALQQTQYLLRKTGAFKRHIHSQSLEVVADLVAAGGGIGILPERVATRYNLKPLDEASWFQDELALCYRKDRQNTVASKLIIAAIMEAKI